MKTLYWLILSICAAFAGVSGFFTLVMTWTGAYQPYTHGPDPLLLLLIAVVFAHIVAEGVKGI